jgi:hypothetical protein
MAAERYDPFVVGPFAVGVRTLEIQDRGRGRVYPAASPPPSSSLAGGQAEQRDAPAQPGEHPLTIFSHFSGGVLPST